MALSASTVFQVMSGATAANVNGAGFNPTNANFLTDGAATSATGNSPVFSSASYNFVAGDVGASIFIKSGTNWTPGYYKIASVSANAATLSAAIGQGIQVNNNRYGTQTVAGVASTASPTGATWGIDYSQQSAAQVTNNVLTGATTACTDATTPFGIQMVGNLIHITAGTGVTVGWYEIVSVSGATATLDRSAGTSYSACTYYLGGAASLGSGTANQTDTNFFALGANSATAGCRFFIQGNASYTINGSPTTLLGNSSWPVIIEGYNLTRGDRPSIASGNQPIFAMAANTLTLSDYSQLWCLSFTGTAINTVLIGNSAGFVSVVNCKGVNSSTAANHRPFSTAAIPNNAIIGCEAVSYFGYGILAAATSTFIGGCYAHDSVNGILAQGAGTLIVNNIIASCTTNDILDSIGGCIIWGNTLYGGENKTGVGINATSSDISINNVLYGFVSGYGGTSTKYIGLSDYNCFFNNTNNIAAATTGTFFGAGDITGTNPSFTNVGQVTGTTATSSGTTLTDSGKNFTTAGVVAGRDYLYVTSATGVTVGIYGITAVGTTTLTTDNSLGTGSAINYQITINRNFYPTGVI